MDAWDFGPGNIGDYSPATSVSDLFNAGAGFLNSAVNAYMGYQGQQLQIDQQKNAIDLAKIQGGAQVDIARAQAQAAILQAQRSAYPAFYSTTGQQSNLDQTLANIGTQLSQASGGNLMLYLTIAGVGIAVLSYLKGK